MAKQDRETQQCKQGYPAKVTVFPVFMETNRLDIPLLSLPSSRLLLLCCSDRPKHVFYHSARTEQNKSIEVLFPKPKPNRTEHVKSA